MEKLTRQEIIDILENVQDELDRAMDRIEELGEFNDEAITPDEELVTDMYISKDRLEQILFSI